MTACDPAESVQEIRLEMDGTYMNVIRFGRGSQNLLILSGISLCGLEGQGKGVAAAYAEFTDRYTVYLFDRKKVLKTGTSVNDMAEDVYCALTMLGIEKADVYGVSQGGMMGLCLAIAHPQLVNKLVLCSSQSRAGESMKATSLVWQELAAQKDVRALNRYFFERVYSPAYRERFQDAFKSLENVGSAADCERFAVLAKACADFDVYDHLNEIRCPVFLLADINDQIISVSSTFEMADRLVCSFYIYQEYGHAVYDEAPDIKQRVFSFLTN